LSLSSARFWHGKKGLAWVSGAGWELGGGCVDGLLGCGCVDVSAWKWWVEWD
jgi:hypothetical protein